MLAMFGCLNGQLGVGKGRCGDNYGIKIDLLQSFLQGGEASLDAELITGRPKHLIAYINEGDNLTS